MEKQRIPLIALRLKLNEIGDLKNIEAYPSENNKFITKDGWNVEVFFTPIEDEGHEDYQIRNVGYEVEGESSQYKKSTYSELIKILKTVSDIVLKYIEDNPNVKMLLFYAANKDTDKISRETDFQKSALYKAIIVDQITQVSKGWTLRETEVKDKYQGFMLYKK